MLYRNNPPNRERWNGLGGKIQPGETPLACVQREVEEEACIDLQVAARLHFAGIVTWPVGADSTAPSGGMYTFIAEFPLHWPTWEGERVVAEGLLCWKPIPWVCNPQNTTVVSNIPHFLPPMLSQHTPMEYFCDYHGEHFVGLIVRPLPQHLVT